ncbi:MAG: DUF3598 family protein [Pleurocapsa sp. SU_5_0]|nr:DUF3598 family protein [Pleurocapsa sp. SU_5_0]NJO97258.1 DUF3598 family protein [Pleurocapsa sp. CRU_1_2]NJR46839.1 DUF3598 family protein [Hyellaceae cyanobacterium CSU_1_1]
MTSSTGTPFFLSAETSGLDFPRISYDEFNVPLAFLRNCGTWEGTARRVNRVGKLIDEHLVRVKIEVDKTQYVQTNTVRINTPREVTAQYYGSFQENKLVFPLTDEVYTLGGEKATGFSGIAWAITDDMIVYRGSRTVQGCKTYYNELITLIDQARRIRTTQLFEDGEYKLVTMIEETKSTSSK